MKILDAKSGKSFDASGTGGSGVSDSRSVSEITVAGLLKASRGVRILLHAKTDNGELKEIASWTAKLPPAKDDKTNRR